jgi:uncharacterized protein (TIGR00255 family)
LVDRAHVVDRAEGRTEGAERSRLASMTGQGVGHAEVEERPGVRVTAEIRCVNHRYFDVRVRASGAVAEHAHVAEDVMRKLLARGRIELALSVEGERTVPRLDQERAAAAFAELVALRDRIAPGEPVPLALLSQVPELFGSAQAGVPAEAMRAAVAEATERACVDVKAMRLREGEALVRDLEARLETVLGLVGLIESKLPDVVASVRARLQTRIGKLMEPGVVLDPGRLEHEVAVFADRSDVAEELTRLRAHVDEVRRVLREPMDGRGKRLDFLCQELGREANTLGQKSADADIGARVIDVKCEIERMREQAQNVL